MGPYFVSPVIAGLDKVSDTEYTPVVCNYDSIGCMDYGGGKCFTMRILQIMMAMRMMLLMMTMIMLTYDDAIWQTTSNPNIRTYT